MKNNIKNYCERIIFYRNHDKKHYSQALQKDFINTYINDLNDLLNDLRDLKEKEIIKKEDFNEYSKIIKNTSEEVKK